MVAKLSPSVPEIEAVGDGSGSGFLVEKDGKLLVITNRHVVEHANHGVAVHFLKRGLDGKESAHYCPSVAHLGNRYPPHG